MFQDRRIVIEDDKLFTVALKQENKERNRHHNVLPCEYITTSLLPRYTCRFVHVIELGHLWFSWWKQSTHTDEQRLHKRKPYWGKKRTEVFMVFNSYYILIFFGNFCRPAVKIKQGLFPVRHHCPTHLMISGKWFMRIPVLRLLWSPLSRMGRWWLMLEH